MVKNTKFSLGKKLKDQSVMAIIYLIEVRMQILTKILFKSKTVNSNELKCATVFRVEIYDCLIATILTITGRFDAFSPKRSQTDFNAHKLCGITD